jgi:hypothetical protein
MVAAPSVVVNALHGDLTFDAGFEDLVVTRGDWR